MVAVRQFDEDEALQQIMEAFWREGFGATSIDDLVAATGLKRGSLYGAFGDKQAMFLLAYRRYSQEMEEGLLALLSEADVRRAMTSLFQRVIADLERPDTPPGCLIANCYFEAAGRGDAIEAVVRKSFARSETAFYERLVKAQADGQLNAEKDPRALARFYAATIRTMALVHRLTGDRQTVEDIATIALERMD